MADQNPSPSRSSSTGRLVAILVLIPATPAWLASMVALALFYLAPARFGALLSRLPGDEFIRSALAFAPAALLAVVILAALYALDRPQPVQARPAPSLQAAARTMLLPLIPLTTISLSGLVVSFIAPDRFWARLEALPGQRYLGMAVNWVPPFLLLVLLVALVLSLRKEMRNRQLGSLAIGLGITVSALLASAYLLALLALSLAPGRFASLLERFPAQSFERLSLLAVPGAGVLATVLGLKLLTSRGKGENTAAQFMLSLVTLVASAALIGVGGAGLVMLLR